jgi:hypothetical protein
MTTPSQPKDPPPVEQETQTNPHGHAPNGIPHGDSDAEPKGVPHSDRQDSETAATT